MSTLKQITANRRNALKSTGPTSPEGKERSRRNALRHGLTSETVITTLEDAEDYQAFEAAVTADYDAETAVERELVLRLASVLWRLRRATGIELALFEAVVTELDKPEQIPRPLVETAIVANVTQLYLGLDQQSNTDPSEISLGRRKELGDLFLSLAALPTCPLDRLSRYEHALWRQARQIVFTLQSMRRRKQRLTRRYF